MHFPTDAPIADYGICLEALKPPFVPVLGAVVGPRMVGAEYRCQIPFQTKVRCLPRSLVPQGVLDVDRVMRAWTLYEFNNSYTAPVFGFRDADDFYERASLKVKDRR